MASFIVRCSGSASPETVAADNGIWVSLAVIFAASGWLSSARIDAAACHAALAADESPVAWWASPMWVRTVASP